MDIGFSRDLEVQHQPQQSATSARSATFWLGRLADGTTRLRQRLWRAGGTFLSPGASREWRLSRDIVTTQYLRAFLNFRTRDKLKMSRVMISISTNVYKGCHGVTACKKRARFCASLNSLISAFPPSQAYGGRVAFGFETCLLLCPAGVPEVRSGMGAVTSVTRQCLRAFLKSQ